MSHFCRSITGLTLLCVLSTGTIFAEGGQITFSAALSNITSHHIYQVDEDGDNFINLTQQYEDSTDPTWRSDGEYLAFMYNFSLCTMRANGNDFENLSVGGGNFAWSPDGQWIAIEQGIADDRTHIFIVNPTGSGLMDVTLGNDSHRMPVWNPATGDLLCLSYADGESFIGEIDVTSKEVYDYSYDANLISFGISFSPDGSQWVTSFGEGIAIVDASSLDYDIIEGTEEMYAREPAWSPDGMKIAYSIYDTERNTSDIYTIDLASLEQKQVTNRGFVGIEGLTWRPDPNTTTVEENQPSPLTLTAAPNPFNPSTTVTYTLAEGSDIELGVYSVLGQKVAGIESGHRAAGTHSIQWNASGNASGVYVIRLKAGNSITTHAVTLMK